MNASGRKERKNPIWQEAAIIWKIHPDRPPRFIQLEDSEER
jgi:hypothetical protein